MDRPARQRPGWLLAVVLLASLLAHPQLADATGGLTLGSEPDAVELSLALGTTGTTSLRLRNTGVVPVSARLFEALMPATTLAAPDGPTQVPLPSGDAGVRRSGPLIDPQISIDQADDPASESEFLVFLGAQADLGAAYALSDWAARGAYVYTTLRAHAEASQQPLRALLKARGRAYRSLWIINAVALRGNADDVTALSSLASVAELRALRVAQLDGLEATASLQTTVACGADAEATCWNIARVGANRVWTNFGVRGAGITVANIDSGVRFDHPALLAGYRGNQAGVLRHSYNWYDPYGGQAAPVDSGNHGTHTMGSMVARGSSAEQPAVGVAPGANWIAARACSARECSELDLILAAEWLLAPTDPAGLSARPDLRPHVINNSWTAGQNALWYTGYVAAWRAAGIYPVFAGGNSGNQVNCGTIQSPGDYADVTAAGAIDSFGNLASFSSIGPGPEGRIKPDMVAPGSGVVSTVADARLYGSNSGTSMATPHLAGAVALLWSANPSLIGDYEHTYQALAANAKPIATGSRFDGPAFAACRPSSVPNNIFGYGELDVYGAVAQVSVDVPWLSLDTSSVAELAAGATSEVRLQFDARRVPGPGRYQARLLVHSNDLSIPPLIVPVSLTVPDDARYATVSGRVTRASDGAALRAMVQVAGGASVATDAQGAYQITLPPATWPYTLSATAPAHITSSTTLVLTTSQQLNLNFLLSNDQPLIAADTTPRSLSLDFPEQENVHIPIFNQGTQPLSYSLSVPNEHYGVWRSDEVDGPSAGWLTPPTTAISLTLSNDGASPLLPIGFPFRFYDQIYEELAVTANGLVSLGVVPDLTSSFVRGCLPARETPGAAIAALRVDLDPNQPGARISLARLTQGTLVSWEHVALTSDPSLRFSFQLLLQPDGRIRLNYRNLDQLAVGESASFGLQRDSSVIQSLGCRSGLGLSDGLSIELRPQPPSAAWLRVSQPTTSLDPGASTNLTASARWIASSGYAWPASGAIVLHSNDPTMPELRFNLRLTTTPAPHTWHFPLVLTN